MRPVGSLLPLLGTENSLFKAIGEIFHPLFVAVSWVLAFIYGIIPQYTIAIALLTIVIMAILTPLTIKSTRSMIAMQALQPELQKLRQKYKGPENREQLNSEMMRLYRESGVSPTGGCLPMFLQMPALIVLYDVIKGLTNTIKHGQTYPAGTVKITGHAAGAMTKCMAHLCAVPRYIPTSSKMYHDLVNAPGKMKSWILTLALKPLSHHAHWYQYVPYFVLVALAVGLQYLQMSQMTKRNKAAAQMNPQMQTMQKVMPLIFAYIYFLVPAAVAIYMVVSSAIRILTQDLIFRYGLVDKPGEREIGTGAKPKKEGWFTRLAGAATPALPPPTDAKPADETTNGAEAGTPKPAPAAGNGGGSKGPASKSGGTTQGSTAPKPHSRSKSKRARKAR
jgi:YidC/Oxa1 family membrane protein insertase